MSNNIFICKEEFTNDLLKGVKIPKGFKIKMLGTVRGGYKTRIINNKGVLWSNGVIRYAKKNTIDNYFIPLNSSCVRKL